MTTPDPQPDTAPGLEPGGGVRPGDTPPAATGRWGADKPEAPPGRALSVGALVGLGILVVAVVVLVIVGAVTLF